jgi:hypothetical protein
MKKVWDSMSNTYNIKYRCLEDYGIIVEKHSGLIDVDKLKQFMFKKKSDPKFSSDFHYLIDIRKTQFTRSVEKVRDFIDFMANDHSEILNQQIAFLTSESEQVAMSTVFQMLYKGNRQRVRIFSTLEHALLWLNVDMDYNEVEEVIRNL